MHGSRDGGVGSRVPALRWQLPQVHALQHPLRQSTERCATSMEWPVLHGPGPVSLREEGTPDRHLPRHVGANNRRDHQTPTTPRRRDRNNNRISKRDSPFSQAVACLC
ncbi:hypothetical protein CCHR01_12900 [Colletotrichum chrysophilum]|uniref:Uncharacterized protein n=1 Tax=Colletotrichum chrysophilum TaxID=1836956 RepID=A0AAD9EE77_9PEZI|nr:hypothetical protein CCHR01_12900 [Colletotrichum chrysophilum]